MKQSLAIERQDMTSAEHCIQFLKLCELNWSIEVSALALRNLTDRKRTGVLYMPLTEDVVKLNKYLVGQANSIDDVLDVVSKTTMLDYSKKKKADSANEVALSLTDFERSLLKVVDRIEIRGKKGLTVPLLLSEEMIIWIDKLVKARTKFIPSKNQYLFASFGEFSHLRGSDVLRKFSQECGATKPELLTSTKLRKHIASLAQVVSLKEHELDSLATFLGHDIRVHTQF